MLCSRRDVCRSDGLLSPGCIELIGTCRLARKRGKRERRTRGEQRVRGLDGGGLGRCEAVFRVRRRYFEKKGACPLGLATEGESDLGGQGRLERTSEVP